jgi:hypothetical protein
MRYVPLNALIEEVSSDEEGAKTQQRLTRAQTKLSKMEPTLRQQHIQKNGPNKWSPLKGRLTGKLGNKCWYTEAELVGAPLTIDHYRPVCDYWWLAYDAENYRVACPYANSPQHNKEHGCAGGKGDQFPLLAPGQRAKAKEELSIESPVILDPCNEEDCDLLAFQADGRPVLNPEKTDVPNAEERVETSKILLNLDHPDFNSKREQLCREIRIDVLTHEGLPEGSESRIAVRARLVERLCVAAPFSTAARFYLQLHRHLDWVEELLAEA